MSTLNKPNQKPESYSPTEIPSIIEATAEKAEIKYRKYKDIEFYTEWESYPETFKIAGVPWQAEFGNITDYHDNYRNKLTNKYDPYTEVGISVEFNSGWNYFFGCRVNSLDNLPEGITGVDTGLKNFAVITFRADNTEKLLGGTDGPGDAMKTAGEYINNVWLPKHRDEVEFFNPEHGSFKFKNNDDDCGCTPIEVYKNTSSDNPEMCFYIPLKDNRVDGKIVSKK